jgi:hypothetical protein
MQSPAAVPVRVLVSLRSRAPEALRHWTMNRAVRTRLATLTHRDAWWLLPPVTVIVWIEVFAADERR